MDLYMLSTIDNPFNPFVQYDEWFAFDASQGYDTPSYLARIAKVSDALPDAEQERIIQDAIDEIVRENILGIYIKVPSNTKKIDLTRS